MFLKQNNTSDWVFLTQKLHILSFTVYEHFGTEHSLPHYTNYVIIGIQTHLWGLFSKSVWDPWLKILFGAEIISLDFLYKSFK